MDIKVRGTSSAGFMIDLANNRAGHSLYEKKIRQDSLELNAFTFEGICVVVLNVSEGNVEILNRCTSNEMAFYGVFAGSLRSGNTDGEVTYVQLKSGQQNLYYPLSLLQNFHLQAPLQALIISMPESYITQLLSPDATTGHFLGSHLRRQKPFISTALPVSSSIYYGMESLISSSQKPGIKRILLEARILELLSSQLEQLDQHYNEGSVRSVLRGRDIDKIYEAKTFIEENIRTPCSLIELSRKVGLNDFKLKKGFREVLGTTVFNYLSDFRMERAKLLLEQKRTVSEVAHEVGYKNPHHFTAAFKKKYGVLPSSFK